MIAFQCHIKGSLNNVFLIILTSISITGTVYIKENIPLKIRYFDVPTPRFAGENALLSCHYELKNNETLYAVKWYKDSREFFRYVPAGNPKYKSLTQPGVDVDSYRSNHNEVYLKNLGLESPGNYTCQVSTEGPYFWCVQNTRYLDVVVPPSNGPVLEMRPEKKEFEYGDNVSIQCTSGKGKPAPDLTWYINDMPAESDPKEKEIIVYADSLESSSLTLKFHLKPEVFVEGKVILKCVASLHQMQTAVFKEIVTSSQQKGSTYSLYWLTPLTILIQYIVCQSLSA